MTTPWLELASPWVEGLHPYVGAPPVDRSAHPDPVRLASNENPLGCGARARQALARAAEAPERYPDGSAREFCAAVAASCGVEPDWVLPGNGSNEILELLGRAFLRPGVKAAYFAHCFAVYPLVVQGCGAEAVQVPCDGWAQNLDALADAVDQDTRLVFLAEPNNPTGSCNGAKAVARLAERLPQTTLLVLDQAYREYVQRPDYPEGVELLRRHPNLVLTRSFSKIHGLAALRVGYGLAHPELVSLLHRVRQPFNCNALAQAAALAALADGEHLERSRRLNAEARELVGRGLDGLGLEWIPTEGNFVSFRVGPAAGEVAETLLHNGVLVRPLASYAMPEHLRVTLGTEGENRRFLQELQASLAARRQG